jgi:hypothetical protein
MTTSELKLLGETVPGDLINQDGKPWKTTWKVVSGPYKATVSKLYFQSYLKDGSWGYTCELEVYGETILPVKSVFTTVGEAVESVEGALRYYLGRKSVIEKRFGPVY